MHLLCMCVFSQFGCVWLFETLWSVACQAPLSKEFSRQEYWSGLPYPHLRDIPDSGIKPPSPELQVDSLPLGHLGSSIYCLKEKMEQRETSKGRAAGCRYGQVQGFLSSFWPTGSLSSENDTGCGHPHFSTVSGGCLGRAMGRCRQQQDSLRPLPRLQFDFCVPSFLLPLSVSYRQKTLEEAGAPAIVLSSGDPSSPSSGLFFTSRFSCGLKSLRGPTLASDTDGVNSKMAVVYYSPCWVYLLLTSQVYLQFYHEPGRADFFPLNFKH